jgi:hypothetical protein
MKLQGEYLFDGPRERVWEMLRDPNALARALPGTQSLEKLSENEYQGQMHVRIGPVAGLFAGRVTISNEVPPESCTLAVDGKGSPGFATGSGDVVLTDQGDGTTRLQYEGEFQVGGKLAAVGQRMVDTVSKSIIRQGLESLNEALREGVTGAAELEPAAEPEAQPSTGYRPPTETRFAAAVAKDVVKDYAGDLMAPEHRAVWLTGLVAILAMLVGYALGRNAGHD